MNEVAKQEAGDSQTSESGSNLIQVIERAASNPDVDVDKMQRLLDMQERILDRNAKMAYTQALAAMAEDLPVITERGAIKDKYNKVQSRYALWEDINEAIRPVLSRHGFHLSFRTGRGEDGSLSVTGVLSHREGHSEETTIYLPADQSGSKNAVQAVGSSTSYGKRYTAAALLNLTTGGEDDDAQAASGPARISADQAATIESLIEEVGADRSAFLKYMKVNKVEDIAAQAYQDAVRALERKRSQ